MSDLSQENELLKKLIADPEKLKAFMEALPEDERVFFEKYLIDVESYLEMNPLQKFKMNNVKQVEFLKFTKPFQYFIGGNKGGKTATITYKGVLIALNQFPGFERKAMPGRPLINWLCGEDRNVLEQTPLQELVKWLRPDQYRIIKKGTYVDRVRIFINKDTYSDFIFKPYSGGVDVFESANINGVILCDEEIPEDILRAMIPRMVAHGAWLLNALTPTHGLTYTRDIIQGSGNYSGLQGGGLVDWIEVATEENIGNIDPKMFEVMLRAYAQHDSEGNMKYGADGKPLLTPEGEIRLRGKFESVTGKVYPTFRKEMGGETWHVYDSEELPNLDECKFFAWSDYGRRDDFVYVLVAVDKNDTHWALQEKYQSGLEVIDQAMAIREISDDWGVAPLLTVADSQIKNKKTSGGTILQEYEECVYPEGHVRAGEPILGPNFTAWRAKSTDKLAPETARAEIGRMLAINKKTGKPGLRFNRTLCPRMINCMENLEWRKGGKQEGTAGLDDHGEAGLRYYTRANIKYENWETEEEAKLLANTNKKYAMGGNYRPTV